MLATHRHRIAPRYRSSSDTRKCRLDAFFDQPGQASLIYNPSFPIINEKRCIECRFRKPYVYIEWGREISHRQIHSLLRWPPFTGACWSAGMRRRQSARGWLALRIEKRSFYPVTRCSPLALRPEGGLPGRYSGSSCSRILHRLDCPAHRKALCRVDIADQCMRSSSESVPNYALHV